MIGNLSNCKYSKKTVLRKLYFELRAQYRIPFNVLSLLYMGLCSDSPELSFLLLVLG
jgi:hypothetical protein